MAMGVVVTAVVVAVVIIVIIVMSPFSLVPSNLPVDLFLARSDQFPGVLETKADRDRLRVGPDGLRRRRGEGGGGGGGGGEGG